MRTSCGGWRAALVEWIYMASPTAAGGSPAANQVTTCRTVVAAIKGETEGGIANEFTCDEVDRLSNFQILGKALLIGPWSRRLELCGVLVEHRESNSTEQTSK